MKVVEERLCSADGECRHQNRAASVSRLGDDARELLLGVKLFVPSVAIGRLDDKVVAGRRAGRFEHDGIAGSAQISAEQHRRPFMSDLDHCRAKDVTRRRELGSDAGAGRESFAKFDWSQEPERGLRIGHRIQWKGGLVFRIAVAVCKLRVPLEQMPTIEEQDLAEVSSRRCAVDLTLESILHQQRQVAGMIEVRVREDDAINRARLDRKWRPIPVLELLVPLEQAAVDQHSCGAELEQGFRARYSLGSSKECQPHILAFS